MAHDDIINQITVIIPAYNEEKGIQNTLNELKGHFPSIHIIVIDDGSTDKTSQMVEESGHGVQLILHERNRGYGAALKTGMKEAKTSCVVWFDADCQHKADDLLELATPVVKGQLDAHLGSRQKGQAFIIKRIPGKWVLKLVSQIVARQSIPDLNCGFRAFRTDVVTRYLHLLPDGFSASSTTTLLMIKRNYRVKFHAISTRERVGSSSVKILRDGFRTLQLMLRLFLLFDAFLFFSTLAIIQIVLGLGYSAYISLNYGLGFPVLGAVVLISGVNTFFIGLVSSQISELRQERFE